MIERIFEGFLVRSRFLVIFSVIFSLIGATVLFIVASVDIAKVCGVTYQYYVHHADVDLHTDGVALIIGAVDMYLIAVVMLIFSFGLYELFISRIDELEMTELKDGGILTITSLDQLKDKLAKVIVMVLIVSFFQRVLHMTYNSPLEMLYLALSILALGLGLHFLNKGGHH
ncbi:membrane protein [Campylobacterota bacterium]|nr:membrane protein [Campylobacterota bacterium]